MDFQTLLHTLIADLPTLLAALIGLLLLWILLTRLLRLAWKAVSCGCSLILLLALVLLAWHFLGK